MLTLYASPILTVLPLLAKKAPKTPDYATIVVPIAIVLFVIMLIYSLVKSFVMFFIVRPRDPELYREYRADKRAHEISAAINNSSSRISGTMNTNNTLNNLNNSVNNDLNNMNNMDNLNNYDSLHHNDYL